MCSPESRSRVQIPTNNSNLLNASARRGLVVGRYFMVCSQSSRSAAYSAMRPRDFVVKNDALMQNCVYSVIPVVNYRFLDLPYHLDRLHRSFSLFEENHSHDDTQIFNQLIADSCLKSISSSDSSNGLLTVCIGSDTSGRNGILSSSGTSKLAADSLFFKMPDDFLFLEKNDLIVDLHKDTRNRDRRIKASCWPLERTNIENTRPTNVIETLLYQAPNNAIVDTSISTEIINEVSTASRVDDELPNILQLTEGLTSNFFACKNDCLITAPDGHSLSGSMSRIVIAAANALGITVLREFPVLEPTKSSSWSSAFLTSAAKPMHGIQTVLGPKGEIMFESPAECKTVTAIRNLLEGVLRNQDDDYLRTYIPYSLWSASVTSETTSSQIRKMFDTHSQYL